MFCNFTSFNALVRRIMRSGVPSVDFQITSHTTNAIKTLRNRVAHAELCIRNQFVVLCRRVHLRLSVVVVPPQGVAVVLDSPGVLPLSCVASKICKADLGHKKRMNF
jgi:hypothetical protein